MWSWLSALKLKLGLELGSCITKQFLLSRQNRVTTLCRLMLCTWTAAGRVKYLELPTDLERTRTKYLSSLLFYHCDVCIMLNLREYKAVITLRSTTTLTVVLLFSISNALLSTYLHSGFFFPLKNKLLASYWCSYSPGFRSIRSRCPQWNSTIKC